MALDDPSTRDDGLLMSWIAAGDTECVEALIDRYAPPLARFLRTTVRNEADAEDLFQEVWLRVVRSAHRFDPARPFRAWLFRIAWNRVRTHWASRKTLPVADVPPSGDWSPPSQESQMLSEESTSHLVTTVRSLPSPLAEAILLRYFEDLSEREMAQRLGVPPGTVKSRLHSGLRRLATILEVEAR